LSISSSLAVVVVVGDTLAAAVLAVIVHRLLARTLVAAHLLNLFRR
jgi:hypothetical protein